MDEDNYKGGFRELDVWKEARKFRKNVSLVTKKFPEYEKYKLNNQLIRASRSITANIAEGYGRFHYQENIQYCRQARGSLMECLEHFYLCA
jgi:four helix bundle protein